VSDAELVERARRGDSAAFGELVGRHRVAVYRAALAALGSPAEAEEAAQVAFLTAYLKLDTFRGQAAFKTWLLSVAWREALDRRRSLRSRLRRLVAPPWEGGNPPEASANGASPEQAFLEREFVGQVRRLLGALPARLRDPPAAGSGSGFAAWAMPMSDREDLDARIDRALRRIAGGDAPPGLEAAVRQRIERHQPGSFRRAPVGPLLFALATASAVALLVGGVLWRERVVGRPSPGLATSVVPAPAAPRAPASAERTVREELPVRLATPPPPALVAPPPDPVALEAASLVEPLEPLDPLAIEPLRWAGAAIDSLRVSGLKVEALRVAPLPPPL
jgi:RNA polymerase sigma factor (sigma-70 family)